MSRKRFVILLVFGMLLINVVLAFALRDPVTGVVAQGTKTDVVNAVKGSFDNSIVPTTLVIASEKPLSQMTESERLEKIARERYASTDSPASLVTPAARVEPATPVPVQVSPSVNTQAVAPVALPDTKEVRTNTVVDAPLKANTSVLSQTLLEKKENISVSPSANKTAVQTTQVKPEKAPEKTPEKAPEKVVTKPVEKVAEKAVEKTSETPKAELPSVAGPVSTTAIKPVQKPEQKKTVATAPAANKVVEAPVVVESTKVVTTTLKAIPNKPVITRAVLTVAPKSIILRLEGTEPIKARTRYLNNPERALLDIEGVWTIQIPKIPANPLAKSLRMGTQTDSIRLVLDVNTTKYTREVIQIAPNVIEWRVTFE